MGLGFNCVKWGNGEIWWKGKEGFGVIDIICDIYYYFVYHLLDFCFFNRERWGSTSDGYKEIGVI